MQKKPLGKERFLPTELGDELGEIPVMRVSRGPGKRHLFQPHSANQIFAHIIIALEVFCSLLDFDLVSLFFLLQPLVQKTGKHSMSEE